MKSKPILLISKGGSVFVERSAAKKSSDVGDAGDTEGLIRHLAKREDVRLVYFGQYRGDHLCEIVETYVCPRMKELAGYPHLASGADQQENFDVHRQRIKDLGGPVIGFINCAGYSPTCSHVENPMGAIVQAAAVLYQAPMLDLIQHFEIPRVVVNTDPRTYPRDQEMSYGMHHCRPAALLDQWNRDVEGVVGGTKYHKRSVYAACQSWGYFGEPLLSTRACPGVVIGHAHLEDGIRTGSHDAWWNVLPVGGNPPEAMNTQWPDWLRVYGRGWENFGWWQPERFCGSIRQNIVAEVLAQSCSCPVVSHSPGFYTGKPWVVHQCGAVPLLYGNGSDSHTWDPLGRYEPLDSEWRIVYRGDFVEKAMQLYESDDLFAERRAVWAHRLVPDFSKLDALVDDLVMGRDWRSESWFQDYGGYRPC